ncbi:MAG: hypothetical protein ABSB29_09685 [Nitrososphaerales archaeon]|jgi:hypothetical protein
MKARPPFLKMRRKYEVDKSHWLVRRSRSFPRRFLFALRRVALTLKWGRVPEIWELFFIDGMREREKKGLAFHEVLRSTLPQLLGEDTSEVLRTWIGEKARRSPEQFARSVSGMFGASARSVLGSIDKLADEASRFEKKAPQEPPIQSLLEAIQRSEAAMTVAQLDKPREKP